MKTFIEWVKLLNEKTARAGFLWYAYPDLYIRSHYPNGWFMPVAADALFKMGKHQPPHAQHVVLNQIPKGL